MNRKKAERRLVDMEANPSGWRFAELQNILEAFGLALSRQKGSDCIFKHQTLPVRFFVSHHGSGRVYAEYVERAAAAIRKVKELGG